MSEAEFLVWGSIGAGLVIGLSISFVFWRLSGPLRRFSDMALYAGGIIGLQLGLQFSEVRLTQIYYDTADQLNLFFSVALLLKVMVLLIAFLLARTALHQAKGMVMMIGELISVVLVFVLFIGLMFNKPVPELLAVALVALGAAGLVSKRVFENIGRGIALSLQPSLNVGNFISFDNKIGKVREITTTHLVVETALRESVLIPHSKIYEQTVVNFSRPELNDKSPFPEVIGRDIFFRLDYSVSPADVEKSIARFLEAEAELLGDLLVSYELAPQVAKAKPLAPQPEEPEVAYRARLIVEDFADYYISYRLRVFLQSFQDYYPGASRLRMDLYDHFFRTEGWRAPYPVMQFTQMDPGGVTPPNAPGAVKRPGEAVPKEHNDRSFGGGDSE